MTFQPSLKKGKDIEVDEDEEIEENVWNASYEDGGEDSDLND